MLERFTERARRVVILAGEEARARRHTLVSPQHLLLGMIRDGGGMAIYALQRRGVALDTLKMEIERAVEAQSEAQVAGEAAFAPGMKRVLALAVQASADTSCRLVGTEHLLLALIQEGEPGTAPVLASHGLTLEEVRRELNVLIGTQVPFSEDNVRLIANSRWRIRL